MTAKIGDGHFSRWSKNSCVAYSSILQDYMLYKKKILDSDNYPCNEVILKDNSAGYNKNGIIYCLYTAVDERITKIHDMPKLDIIDSLDYFGFLMYYFDDGSYHKAHNIMHIYCNSFTPEEVEHLKKSIYRLFPYKECRNRVDKKKNGKQYPYLYIPKDTTTMIVKYYKEFVLAEPLLDCMAYKLGVPSQTIEKQ